MPILVRRVPDLSSWVWLWLCVRSVFTVTVVMQGGQSVTRRWDLGDR